MTACQSLDAIWPGGLKRTKQRYAVLEALDEAPLPLTAMELAARLEHRGDRVPLSTIYRVLESFVSHGVVLKTPVLDSGIAIYELARNHHRHYAVCVLCSRVIAMENCPMDSFLPRLSEKGFHILGHQLQMYGYCESCASKQQGGPASVAPQPHKP